MLNPTKLVYDLYAPSYFFLSNEEKELIDFLGNNLPVKIKEEFKTFSFYDIPKNVIDVCNPFLNSKLAKISNIVSELYLLAHANEKVFIHRHLNLPSFFFKEKGWRISKLLDTILKKRVENLLVNHKNPLECNYTGIFGGLLEVEFKKDSESVKERFFLGDAPPPELPELNDLPLEKQIKNFILNLGKTPESIDLINYTSLNYDVAMPNQHGSETVIDNSHPLFKTYCTSLANSVDGVEDKESIENLGKEMGIKSVKYWVYTKENPLMHPDHFEFNNKYTNEHIIALISFNNRDARIYRNFRNKKKELIDFEIFQLILEDNSSNYLIRDFEELEEDKSPTTILYNEIPEDYFDLIKKRSYAVQEILNDYNVVRPFDRNSFYNHMMSKRNYIPVYWKNLNDFNEKTWAVRSKAPGSAVSS